MYTKTRAQFGRWCSFAESGPKMEIDIQPEPSLMHNFIRKDPITQGTQCSKIFAEHEVNSQKMIHNFIYFFLSFYSLNLYRR